MPCQPPRVAIMLDLHWPYKRHTEIFAGVQRYAEEQGWESIIDEYAHDAFCLRTQDDGYDGIVARANLQLARRALKRGVPVVNVWPSSPAWHLLPGVFPDSTETGRLIAEHLLARGLRAFATMTSPANVDNELEIAEFTRVVRAAGFECSSAYIPHDLDGDLVCWRKAVQNINRAMDKWALPIGVYIGQETVGRLVVQAARRRKWRIPADVAIVAGKNQETLCEKPRPSLTSVEIGYDRIGYAAAELLARLMAGHAAPAVPIRVAPHGVVVRESTDFFAVEDPTVAAALTFIAANSHRPIGPDDVSAAVGVETRTLQNYFQRTLRRPIAAEIRRVRIERAKRELAQSGQTLATIARTVGFSAVERLNEVFRREIGMSPGAYRKKHRLRND